ncbi:MAG: hypothetical protein SCM11_10735 [Bacillota bacterium]|nr:hypothetical protein [Bacillota bacterium]
MVETVIVTIKMSEHHMEKDIECVATIPFISILSRIIDYYWSPESNPGSFSILIDSENRYFDPALSCVEAGIWDGASLSIHQSVSKPT